MTLISQSDIDEACTRVVPGRQGFNRIWLEMAWSFMASAILGQIPPGRVGEAISWLCVFGKTFGARDLRGAGRRRGIRRAGEGE
jgi:hypothetical protein